MKYALSRERIVFVKLQPASNMANIIKDEINGDKNESVDC